MEEHAVTPSTLYVDLDGTFTKSDLLFESLIISIKNNPLILFLCFFWLLKGKANLKHQLSQCADVNTKLLPLNSEFYAFLLDEKTKGRSIVLATASHEKYAEQICNESDIFDSYISSDINTNLKGQAKLLRIQSENEVFSYAGNSREDFIIFEKCKESYLVNPTRKAKRLAAKSPTSKIFDDSYTSKLVWIKQLRVHQWIKNVLIFVPLLVTAGFTNLNSILFASLAFISFSFLASATYIINDLLDLESDRNHKRKKFRPLAAGTISILHAKLAALILFSASLYIALNLNSLFAYTLVVYLVLTLLYSFKIKQYIAMDVIVLACLYTIRIIAGAAVLNVPVSFWLLSFSMFVFFSLALIKRCSELVSKQNQDDKVVNGRDYNISDYGVLLNFGTSSALLSVLMFCFYVNNNILTNQFLAPNLLWLIIPALCYWLMRMWIKTHRGEMHDDPIIYALKDKGSLITISFIVFITVVAQIL
tara:strand:+ start:24 stop:1454 length:1431 start_codon:yes stop_codon:yes gene_type:complete